MFPSPRRQFYPVLKLENRNEVTFKWKVIQKGYNMKSFMLDVKSKDVTCSVSTKCFEKS